MFRFKLEYDVQNALSLRQIVANFVAQYCSFNIFSLDVKKSNIKPKRQFLEIFNN